MVSIENVQSFLDRGTYIGGAFIELKNTFDTWNNLFRLETIHPVLEKFWPV